MLNNLDHDDIVRMMVGRDLRDLYQRELSVTDDEAIRVENLSLKHPDRPNEYLIDNVNFYVRRGEVLGVFGLMGSGRTELLETVFGQHRKYADVDIYLEGRKVSIQSAADAINAGIGLAPEDRKDQGLVLMMNVSENISLASLGKIT